MPLPASFIVIAAGAFGTLFDTGPPAELPPMRRYEPPVFPLELRASSLLDGYATAAFTVDAEGKILDVLILEANHPAFGKTLEESIRVWQLQPQPRATEPRREVVRFIFMRTGKVGSYSHRDAARAAFASSEDQQPSITTLTTDQLEEKPTRLQGKPPSYPGTLKQRQLVGQTTVSFVIDTDGRVRVPVVMNAAHPEFGVAALEAVRQWRYSPVRHRGQAVLVEDAKTFTFGSPK
jgi:TonB family protein